MTQIISKVIQILNTPITYTPFVYTVIIVVTLLVIGTLYIIDRYSDAIVWFILMTVLLFSKTVKSYMVHLFIVSCIIGFIALLILLYDKGKCYLEDKKCNSKK